jgi:anaerobic ribonucleoside-triphosphate reductase activating protein
MKYSEITYPDVNNGEGCRVTLFVSGCSHRCKGCHNPETWNFDFGKDFNDEVKIRLFDIVSKPYIKGLTLSGGDPLDSYDDVLDLVKEFRNRFGETKDIWVYTGYVIDDLLNLNKEQILDYIDVLVDGEYIEEQRDVSLAFRGSKNQRIIRLKERYI